MELAFVLYIAGMLVSYGVSVVVLAYNENMSDRDWLVPAVIIWPIFAAILAVAGALLAMNGLTTRLVTAIRTHKRDPYRLAIKRDLIASVKARQK